MGQYYKVGETKVRPGTYFRYENGGGNNSGGAVAHSVAIPIQAKWGPVDKVTVHESVSSVISTYGSEGTVDAALALFEGGASKVYCIRLDKATSDTSGTAAANATLSLEGVTITAKYPGTKEIKVQTRVKVEGVSKEIVVYDGTTKAEAFSFASGDNEVENLITAVAASSYITAKAGTGTTVAVKDITALTGGADPTITTESYSEALVKLEVYKFTHIALDCVTTAVQTLVQTWLERVYEEGKLCIAVFGGTNYGADISTLTLASKSFDEKKIVYSGIWGRDTDGNIVDGYRMAALVAGSIASTPSDQSIVHKTVPGIASIEPHTNAEYEEAIESGLLLASYSSAGVVWFDSGVNTLVNLSSNEDKGWKKIRRVTTRFELERRKDEVLSSLVGRINCNPDGVAIAIQFVQGVLNAMISEGKLKAGATVYEDPANPHEGDSLWLVIVAVDNDSLEKIYSKIELRYSENS